ncbi:MAG TPA: S53 family peptidase [Vicinamibacterales bacterium]|jgi:subtilase family serine protease|nr:S53 family peptidase [Vicinamibacterales bacterium]
MKPKHVAVAFSLLVGITTTPGPFQAKPRTTMAPFLKAGPLAIPADVAGPGYGIFTCQVGLSVGACYDPYQMRHAYGIDTLISDGFDGAGKTIVIVDAFQSPNIVQQLNFFDSFYGLPGLNGLGGPPNSGLGTFTVVAPDGLTPFVAGDPNMTGWAEEISLDVLWAHAIAPGANITLVLAKSNNDPDILSATKYAVDRDLGDVISQSFGENESCVDPDLLAQEHQVFSDATMKNITIFASSADEGAAQPTCDGASWVKAASSPASDPLVTAVGGTELHAAGYCLTALGCNPAANPAPGTHLGEIAWNEGFPFGDFQANFGSTIATGGGFSVLYDEPSYQKGTIHGGKQRGVPDVSYNAAVLHGVLTYLNIPGIPVGFYRFGGTSAGSPQWAAILAIADQRGGDLGFINRALYHIGQAKGHYSASFFDVTSGTNSALEFDASNNPVTVQGFNAGPGWDATTGLGSPMTGQLVDELIQHVSSGDGTAAVAETKPHANGKPSAPGHVRPH